MTGDSPISMYVPCTGFGPSAKVTDTRGLNALQAAPGSAGELVLRCGHAVNGLFERVAQW